MNKEITIYHPPKANSFGHSTIPRKLEKVWPAINSFLEKHTIYDGPNNITLNAYHATQWDDDKIASSCIEKVIQRFGEPENDSSLTFQDGKGNYKRDYVWRFEKSSFGEALEFLIKGSPWPKQVLGPVALNFHFRFFWKDFKTGIVLQGQELDKNLLKGQLKSSLLVMLRRDSFIQPGFGFPFPFASKEFEDFLSNIYSDLPFRMNLKHLRQGLPNKTAKGYIHRKIEHQFLLSLEEKIKRIRP